MSEPSIRFLTFNTWGLKYVSKFRKERLQEIANILASDENNQYDIIALQEIWVQADWEYLEYKLKDIYPFRRRFSSGIISGPGLAIISKIPIESTFLYRFPINGRPSAFFRGDWFVGKSISVTMLKTSALNSKPIAVLNSHMHAPYTAEGDAAYECHRACQAWDFSNISKLLGKAGYAVIVVGDLNSKPGSLPHSILTKNSGLRDSWEVLQKLKGVKLLSNAEIAELEPEQQLIRGATTCDSNLNSWRAYLPIHKACRLDYMLIDQDLKPLDAGVRMTETLNGVGSLSDHFAYYCKFTVSNNVNKKGIDDIKAKDIDSALSEKHDKAMTLQSLIHLIDDYKQRTILQWQARWRLAHVVASIILIVGLHVMIPFTSTLAGWSSVLVLLATTIIAILATGNFLILALFLPKEYRALEEVKMEVEDCIKNLTS